MSGEQVITIWLQVNPTYPTPKLWYPSKAGRCASFQRKHEHLEGVCVFFSPHYILPYVETSSPWGSAWGEEQSLGNSGLIGIVQMSWNEPRNEGTT